MIVIKFLSLNPMAVLPVANGEKSVGLDLVSVTTGYADHVAAKFDTGVVLHPDSESEVSSMFVSLRSGFADKNSVWMVNSPGIIEPNFRGFVDPKDNQLKGICLSLISHQVAPIKQGDRIGQMVIFDKNGVLMIPNRDYQTEFGDTCYDVVTWERKYKARGGFGSTNVSQP